MKLLHESLSPITIISFPEVILIADFPIFGILISGFRKATLHSTAAVWRVLARAGLSGILWSCARFNYDPGEEQARRSGPSAGPGGLVGAMFVTRG